jgi:hydroxymethylglutaryl-CoA lyase
VNLPRTVRLTEVSPRDGLQNAPRSLTTTGKITLIRMLAAAGIKEMEVTSFVSPKAVPNLADAGDVIAGIHDLKIQLISLVVNDRGYDRAVSAGSGALTFVLSATEGHNRANVNHSRDESIEMLSRMLNRAHDDGIDVRLSISVAFGCPFEGNASLDSLLRLVDRMVRVGFCRIGLCDTIGVANPKQVYDWTRTMRDRFAGVEWELHLHDTYGRGLSNILAALEAGVSRFDASVGGLGGCPFAPGATGNVSTEDLVSMLDGMGIATGIDLGGLVDTSDFLATRLGGCVTSHLWQVSQSRRACSIRAGS